MFPVFLQALLIAAAAICGETTVLREHYYAKSCPRAEPTVRALMWQAMKNETRSVASVMRLMFHDCFVEGCDASVLLDNKDGIGEKLSLANIGSVRSFEVIDHIKKALECICPGVVSCADLLIMAARDAIVLSGGPDWNVTGGRMDSRVALEKQSDDIIPSSSFNATKLIDLFRQFNLTVKDLVALSGAHSIGELRCFSLYDRLYNQSGTGKPDPQMDSRLRKKLLKLCPAGGDENVTTGLDGTFKIFDNQLFKDLIHKKGLLNSDQVLFTYRGTRKYVLEYSRNQTAFFVAFVEAMIKMGNFQSNDVSRGAEIRKNCRVVNPKHAEGPQKAPVLGEI